MIDIALGIIIGLSGFIILAYIVKFVLLWFAGNFNFHLKPKESSITTAELEKKSAKLQEYHDNFKKNLAAEANDVIFKAHNLEYLFSHLEQRLYIVELTQLQDKIGE